MKTENGIFVMANVMKKLLFDLLIKVWKMKECLIIRKGLMQLLCPFLRRAINLSSCDNWRGIAARIIQMRLQEMAKEELPESRCGFCKGRGCSDMIFVVRQLMEKTIEPQMQAIPPLHRP